MQTYLSISKCYFASLSQFVDFSHCQLFAKRGSLLCKLQSSKAGKSFEKRRQVLPVFPPILCFLIVSLWDLFCKEETFLPSVFSSACFCPCLHVSPRQDSAVEKVDIFIFLNFDSSTIFFLGVLERIKKVPLGLSSKLLYIFFCWTSASACPSFTLNMANEYSGKFYEEEVFCLSKLNERLWQRSDFNQMGDQ